MPHAHFECPSCQWHGLRAYPSSQVGTADWPPRCGMPRQQDGPRSIPCRGRLVVAPRPSDYSMDLRTDGAGARDFHKFTVTRQVPTRDGLVQQTETIDSLHKLRQVEKDSEQRYRDGEGEPLRFRMAHQDRSNRDVNSFGDSGAIGSRAYDSGHAPQRSGKVGVARHGQEKPKIPVAKGGGVTALKG